MMTVVRTREDYPQTDADGWARDLVKHVARDTHSRTFDKDLIKRCVCHMTSTIAELNRTNKFLSYNLQCLILVQFIKSSNKPITQQTPSNSAVIGNQYRKHKNVIPLDSSVVALFTQMSNKLRLRPHISCVPGKRNKNYPQIENFHIY